MRLFAFLSLLCIIFPIYAGKLAVYPTKITIQPHENVGILNLKNTTEAPISVQLDLKRWLQENGEDRYLTTHQAFVIPEIIQIPPHQSRIIRIGIRQHDNARSEVDYRLFIQEIPPPQLAPHPSPNQLQVMLQIILPIFLLPQSPPVTQYDWAVEAVNQHHAKISLTNHGNIHLMLTHIILTDLEGRHLGELTQLNYILPQTKKFWEIALNKTITKDQIKIIARVHNEKNMQPLS